MRDEELFAPLDRAQEDINAETAAQELADFYDELPTLQCGPDGCHSCRAAFVRSCAIMVPGPKQEARESAWDEATKPDLAPAFLEGFDDDFILDSELGGESG